MADELPPEKPTTENVRATLRKLMKDHNYDPFKEMILIAKNIDSPLPLRAKIASDLAEFLAPKLKGIDIDAKASGTIQVVVQQYASPVLDTSSSVQKGISDKVIEITDVSIVDPPEEVAP